MTLNFVSFDVGAVAAVHTHPHDQMGIVLEGQMEFEINGQRHTVGPGEVYSVPGNVPHGARAVGDRPCVALDVFAPRRDDFSAVARGVSRAQAK
jgi:quercetin dioxygenase-like cupin family protein